MFTKSAAFYNAVYSWKDYKAESDVLHTIIQQHKRAVGNTLLDVGCGTGGHFPYLCEHYTSAGLDLDAEMLAVAQQQHPTTTFHQGDMQSFDLGRQFDILTCLFSSIGYVKTVEAMHQTIANFAKHTKPGGVIIIEPWFSPGQMHERHVGAVFVDQPELKISRMNVTTFAGNISTLNFHYLVGTPDGINYFTEQHEMGLFTHDEYMSAFPAAGLEVIHDEKGLTGRGLYIAIRPL